MKKIKVVWICHFSNEKVRSVLKLQKHPLTLIAKGYLKEKKYSDFAVWVTEAIKEFEKFEDVDLHIIAPHIGLINKEQCFILDNIHYYFYKSEDDNFISSLKSKIKGFVSKEYLKNRIVVKSLINKINPDIVHVIGAENPYYSITALDVPDNIPVMTSLQTLMSAPNFFDNYPISKQQYDYRASIEKKVICKSDYICTTVERSKKVILNTIKKNAIFIPLKFAIGVTIDKTPRNIKYDFVYFAKEINKAGDLAIEAFGIVAKRYPNITLNMVGAYSTFFKDQINLRIKQLGIQSNVIFSGFQPSYKDVLNIVKESRFALLPIKFDFVSSTITESMGLGLPVVTTITEGTPTLNKNRQSVLLSKIGDHEALAENIIELLKNESLQNKLRENAYVTFEEIINNKETIDNWRKAYHSVFDNIFNE